MEKKLYTTSLYEKDKNFQQTININNTLFEIAILINNALYSTINTIILISQT